MIYFLGDVHGQLDHVLSALSLLKKGDVNVIFLGDIEAQRPFEDEIRHLTDAGIGVWFIHGNHDTDNLGNWENLLQASDRNLHGRVVEIEGIRIAGLGGIFRGEVWYPDRPAVVDGTPRFRNYKEYIGNLKHKTPPRLHASIQNTGNALKHQSSIFPDTYDEMSLLRADILVTHEAPSCHPHGFRTIDHLAQVMGVKTLFHGHHHDNRNYQGWEDELGFCTHGVCFRGVTDMRGNRMCPVSDESEIA